MAKRLMLKMDTPESREGALQAWGDIVITHTMAGRLGAAIDELLMKIEHQLKAKSFVRTY